MLCIYVLNLLIVAFLLVPPAPSSTIIKSASTKAAPISVPPSKSKAAKDTLFAVDIVDNLESPIEPANFEAAIEPANWAFVIPPANLPDAIEPANIALVTPPAFTCNVSEDVSIDESSTFTVNVTPPDEPPPLKPSPAVTAVISPLLLVNGNWDTVICFSVPASDKISLSEPATVIPVPSVKASMFIEPAGTFVKFEPSP